MEALNKLSVCLAPTESDCEMFASPVSASAPGFDLSASPLLPGVSNSELFVLPVSVCVRNPEFTVCPVNPVTTTETIYELPAFLVSVKLDSKPTVSSDSVSKSDVKPIVSPISANGSEYEQPVYLASITELSFYSVSVNEFGFELSVCPVSTKSVCELSACLVSLTEMSISPVSVNTPGFDLSAGLLVPSVSHSESFVLPVSIQEPNSELLVVPVSVHESDVVLSVCVTPVRESNCELSPQSASANVPNIEQFVCSATLNETHMELSALSVTGKKPTFEPLTLPVLRPETINALHVFHVNPVNAIETIQELSACSVFQNVSVEPSTLPAPVSKPVCELFVCPVSVSEPFDDCFVFPAMVPKTVNAPPALSVSALLVLSVSALPRSRSLPWFPAQSAFLCWSSGRSAPPRWPSAQVWWPSAPPWGSSARVRWSSAQPWRTSAPPWWAPVPSAPPWWAPVLSAPPWWAPGPSAPPWWAPVPSAPPWWAPVPSSPPWLPALPTLPRSTATPLPRGPGPPSLPLFRLRSTALLDYIGASGSRSLGGGACHESCPCTSVHSPPEVTRSPHWLLHFTNCCTPSQNTIPIIHWHWRHTADYTDHTHTWELSHNHYHPITHAL